MTRFIPIGLDYPIDSLLNPPTKPETVVAMGITAYLQKTQKTPHSLVSKCVLCIESEAVYGLVTGARPSETNETFYQIQLGVTSALVPESDLLVLVQVIEDD